MEQALRLTQVRGAAATGLYLTSYIFFLSSIYLSFTFHLSAGTKGSGGELRHLAGSPGGRGVIRSCPTLVRVNTV